MSRRILILVALLGCCSPGWPQSKEGKKEIVDGLQGKVLSLRSFSKNNHQHFDLTGQPGSKDELGSWTIYSKFEVKKVEVGSGRVRLHGPRVIHFYDKKLRTLVSARTDKEIDVELEVREDASLKDVSAAIAKIAIGKEGLTPYVPDFWKPYLSGTATPAVSSGNLIRAQGVPTVRVINQPPPHYPQEAKQFRLEGLVILDVEINEDGKVGSIRIMLPGGAGFDEAAIDAVREWVYAPVIVDGKPLRVVTTVTINFNFNQ